ncbi:IS3 family transposase [Acinetobacter harbinensis]|uniref:IS3 family transposase n=1 Tax=Acinetobacter harbinensis TaxID=1353941 RepID=UPI001C4EF4FE|nr:IS3 family transposase [Acinetobacter harbinensis]
MALNRSSIYRHKQVKPKQISEHEQHIVQRICATFKMSGQNYGSRRIQRTLHAENIMIGRYKVRRIMRQHGLVTTWRRKFIKTTDSKHNMTVAQNVLNQQFNPTEINKAWVADMRSTASQDIQTASGWLYLAAVMWIFTHVKS